MQQNRLFTTIAIGLVVALGLGLLGIGGWALIIRPRQQAALAEMTGTPIADALTPTPTSTPTLIPPASPTATRISTSTPVLAQATATPVATAVKPTNTAAAVSAVTATVTIAVQATKAPATATPVPPTAVPQTGFGPGVGVLAAAGLAALLFGARRLRKN